ncbi:respiratory chain complex I subunit 1 family protein [Campylobacter pinnipediorum]|uniref:Hydrogenase n=1 Tax=Campylobacter pinnipediorum subsp. pinnipediorum TaxID=1660067 RepID=A0AAX0LC09_9BACT|nr:NADH-quinone oxidoreductase subunit H [Campylobacter pinnipediorum]AQW82285.1 hydrogenase-4, component C [Campylobacter pinnipediorum subsp. pinnipediorum]OPA81942.1 hydrogenase [Campylobacter pinnipediorum subsp. pinnipediorum]
MQTIFLMIFQVVVIVLVAPLFDGMARKLRAKLQSKQGSDFFQTYRDIKKLFKRGRTTPSCAHWVFRYAPFVLFAVSAGILAAIPITYNQSVHFGAYADIFVIIYLGALFRFIFGAASMDSGNPFAATGGSREQMIGIFVEPVMIMCLIVVMLAAKTSNLVEIQEMVKTGTIGYQIPSFAVASIAFLWCMYAETGRKPFDLAEAEQELQEGLLGEYAGYDLGLVQAALILKQFAMIGLFLTIFEPWNFSNPILAIIVFVVKTGVFYVAAVFIDNFGPRFKVTSSLRNNALFALGISFIALSLYALGV